MSTFILTLDLTDHLHDHSPRAHRHTLGQLLDTVKQKVGSSEDTEGEIVHGGAFNQKVIGSWKFLDQKTD